MPNVYIEQQGVPELPMSLVFWPNFRFEISPKRLFLRDIMEQYQAPFFAIVTTPEEADFFAVPFEFFDVVDRHAPYLENVYAKAQTLGKEVLLFDYTDYVDRVPKLPAHAILFRVSVYRHHKRNNELIMPYFVEDLGKRYAIAPKVREREPSIGYCGQSDFASFGRHVRALVKRCLSYALLLARFDKNPSVHKRGIFWRRKALSLLSQSGLECNFVVRRYYSLHQKSGSFEPRRNRDEYVENLRTCDLALCTRGDANASQRFYEALSASRIPLFLDTDCVLPLEELISYDECMVRVPSNDLGRIAQRVHAWNTEHDTPAFLKAGERARQLYEKYLRLDCYFACIFDREKSPYRSLLYGA